MTAATVERSELFGRVKAVPSKSYAHRILICSAFADRQVRVKGIEACGDVLATLGCLRALGVGVELKGGVCVITPIKRIKNAVLNCGESGATLRFLLAVVSAAGGEFTFKGEGRLPDRPVDGLINALKAHGATVDGSRLPITLSGRLCGGEYVIDGGVSSQYVSALMLAAPIIGEDVRITVTGDIASRGYVDMTVAVMRAFGVSVEECDGSFYIKGEQRYASPGEIEVEGDWSAAAFFIAGGLLCGRVEISGLNPNSLQGDRKILDIIKSLGGSVGFEDGVLIAERSTLRGREFCVENIIDAAPVLAVLSLAAGGRSVMRGASRLKDKESDRLSAIVNMLRAVGGREETDGSTLYIYGADKPCPCALDGCNDHRMVMASVVLGGYMGGISVSGIDAVNKSYPAFFEDYRSVGGVFSVE